MGFSWLLIVFAFMLTSNLSFAAGHTEDEESLDYGMVLVPGKYWQKGKSGYEVSGLFFMNDFGMLSGFGPSVGFDREGIEYAELEAAGHGMGMISLVLGVGAGRSVEEEKTWYPQGTLSVHFMVPAFVYVRAGQNRKPIYGMMFKFPIPFARRKNKESGEKRWVFGVD